jgi:hypothetical protein
LNVIQVFNLYSLTFPTSDRVFTVSPVVQKRGNKKSSPLNIHTDFMISTKLPRKMINEKLKAEYFPSESLREERNLMKKSILMAIVALALLAAPAFAGDYAIVGNIDWGFGTALGGAEDVSGQYNVTNDFTMLGFFGSIDANNSIGIVMEYGASGGGTYLGTGNGVNVGGVNGGFTYGNPGGLLVMVTEFSLTTNILGSFGLTDLPVTLNMTAGYGRLNLHNRFQQWTGWEIFRWKGAGTAHFAGSYSANDPGAWSRPTFMKFTLGIMNMVNVAFGVVPTFAQTITNSEGDVVSDIPMMIDVWTSGIAVGPAALDISANLRSDSLTLATGVQVTANMNFGALSLLAFVGEDYIMSTDPNAEGFNNGLYVAVKPSYNFGAGTVSLGAWMGMTTDDDGTDSVTTIDVAVDLAASFSTFTVYGGVKMFDLTDEAEADFTNMKYDIGVKNAFGAATIGLGIQGVVRDDGSAWTDGSDIGAADGTANTWTNTDGDAVAGLYMRVTAWY